MENDLDKRIDVAADVLDGAHVDWAALDSAAQTDHDRLFLRHLRAIAAIPPFAATTDLHDSILHPSGARHSDADAPRVHWGALRIIEKVGRGSFGDVYRAWDTRLDREVALKLLRRREREPESAAVIEEGRLMARVRHPNVVTVYGAERIAGRTGVWMEFIHGQTLEDELRRRGPLPAEEVAAIGVTLCTALDAVHAAGLLHRDLKTQNIMRDTIGRLVLMDFGAGHEAGDTNEGLAGTPAYLTLELLDGAAPDAAADVYALGVVLFRLSTGQFPVAATTVGEVRLAHRAGSRRSVRSLRPDFPRRLAGVIDDTIDPLATRRFSDVGHLRSALAAGTPRPSLAVWWWAAGVGTLTVAGWFLANGSLPAADQGPRVRTLWADPKAGGTVLGDISSDGRYVTYVNYEERQIVLHDLSNHTERAVVATAERGEPEFSALSHDGTQIAYGWAGINYQLRAGRLGETGSHRTLIGRDRQLTYVMPLDWSPDGTQIAATLGRGDDLQLVLVDTVTGAVRVLKDAHWGFNPEGAFSPDGAYLAVNLQAGLAAVQHDIYLIKLATGEVNQIARPSHEQVVGWSPDGRHLVFLSDRAGGSALWAIETTAGRTVSEPMLLRPGVTGTPLGVNSSGGVVVAVPVSDLDVHLATVDLDSGRLLSAPVKPISVNAGTNRAPAFSPDGRWLSYVSTRAAPGGGTFVMLQSIDDGSIREFHLPIKMFRQLSWSPDSRSIIGLGNHVQDGIAVHRIDVESGASSVLMKPGGSFPEYSPDMSRLYFRRPLGDPPFEYVERDLASGHERVLLRHEAALVPALSPDGRHVAAVLSIGAAQHGPQARALIVMPSTGGSAIQLLRSDHLGLFLRWTPDSAGILVNHGAGILAVRRDGSARQTLDLGVPVNPLRQEDANVHPDGKRLVFMAGQRRTELRAIERALPNSNRR